VKGSSIKRITGIKRIKSFVLSIFLILYSSFSILSAAPTAHADTSNFDTSYAVTYSVNEDASTHAVIKVELKNTTTQYYASSYKLEVGFQTLTNLKASDPDGAITPKVTKSEDGNQIDLTFNDRSVGLGSVLPFTISFDTPDVAKKNGKIYEINIPGISNAADFSAFAVDVHVPKSFGQPSFIKPEGIGQNLHFTKEDLGKSGISIAFGSSQIYDFSLTYHLRNENVYPIETTVALPPNTNYQSIAIDDMQPQPETVKTDIDGNWLATYRLSPKAKTDIVATGKAQLFLNPKKESLSAEQRKLYTKEQPYWQTTNATVKKLATDLKTPEAIYDYVVKTLTYDFSRVTDSKGRLGAVKTLSQPDSAVCLEFTDLFIALARSAGIPAREINGYAYTENSKQRPLSLVKDILHAWPEYYDDTQQTWVMVDPTWGNTTGGVDYFHTFDFDHFAFVVQGADSSYPITAGGYKYAGDENKKDVFVDFSKTDFTYQPQFSLTASLPKSTLAGLPIKGSVDVKNTGNIATPAQVLIVSSTSLTPHEQEVVLDPIPPFGNKVISASFDKQPILTNKTHNLTIQVASQKITEQINIYPFFLSYWMLGGVVIVILIITVFRLTRRSRSVPLSGLEQEDSLRGQGEKS
jgi:transglutaminase-like putative cysteine protease